MERDRDVDVNGLNRLSDLSDYEVADGDPDVRGWPVFTNNGIKFGEVEELIVDTDRMKVRYLDIDVDKEMEGVAEDHHLLIPIGAASVDEKDDQVFIKTIETSTLLKCPPYKGAITRDYEDKIRSHYWPERTHSADEDYYGSEYYDEDRFYGPRRKR